MACSRSKEMDSGGEAAEDSDSIFGWAPGGTKRARRPSHGDQMLQSLNKMRHNPNYQSLFDVDLIVAGRRFPAHRIILASVSPVFAQMFTNGMKETDEREIVLRELDPDSWALIMDYIYSDEDVDLKGVGRALSVLEGVRRFQIDSMLATVESYLASALNPDNCCTILGNVDKYDLTKIRGKALATAASCFEEVSNTPTFGELDVDMITTILSSTKLVMSTEVRVFDAVLAWLNVDDDQLAISRLKYKERLFDLIDLDNMREMDLKLIAKHLLAHNDASLKFREKLFNKLFDIPNQCPIDSEHMMLRQRYSQHHTITFRIFGISHDTGHVDEDTVVYSPWSGTDAKDLHWRLECYPRGYDNKKDIALSLHLKAKQIQEGYGIDRVRFHMFLVKAGHSTATGVKLSREIETAELIQRSWGFKSLIPLSKIYDEKEGFIDKKTDSIVVGTTVYFLN